MWAWPDRGWDLCSGCGMEKKNEAKVLDSEMLTHANPGHRA